jgi:1-deoxy-D-xylulose-5-phosphate synthase
LKKDLLDNLSLPEDIKKLNIDEESELCEEIRQKIIKTVSKNGGHLSSNLGVVELTVALHKVFDSPQDKIIFDVGHQSYTHKLLTGRLADFDSLRKKGGISGFLKPKESVHDPVVSGHSSTSISAALGIAQAMKLCGDKHHAIAVIGDGALTGGLSYEGLNNAGKSDTNIIVIVNYNEMSISKNIGGMAEYLSRLRTTQSYKQVKSRAKSFLEAIPLIGKPLKKSISLTMDIVKGHMFHSTLFEDLGFEFIGPVDGHDLKALEMALTSAKSVDGPVLVQINTVKGKGYKPAEQNPGEYHGVSGFEIESGKKPASSEGFSDIFGKELVEAAKNNNKICAITAAMKYGTGLNYFSKAYPDRFFDVGIAEEHAVSFASGLIAMGMIPVFAVYSSFLQRCYDQLVHDISIANMHLVLAICNAGIVGEDGETHQGLLDVPFLTTIPNVTIYSPACQEEIKYCLDKALFDDTGIACVRFPRGALSSGDILNNDYRLTRRGSDKLVISYGRISFNAESAALKAGADHLRLLKIWPISDEIIELVNSYKQSYMFEEASYSGSLGEKLSAQCKRLESFGIKGYVQHMSASEALYLYGLSEEKMYEIIGDEGYAKT